jgi:hypothetical protein
MYMRLRNSRGWALVLVGLGVLALYGGPQGLALLIPAAILVWYAVPRPTARDHRD